MPSFQEVEDFVEDQVPAAVDEVGSGGFLLEEEAEEEDFTSRLAALAEVPIDDEIFQAIDEDQRELAFEQSLAEPSPSAADEGAIGDDWLQAPGEGELWGSPQPEAAEDDANASLPLTASLRARAIRCVLALTPAGSRRGGPRSSCRR